MRAFFVGVLLGSVLLARASATTVPIGAGAPQATGSLESGWTIAGDFQRLLGQPSRAWAVSDSALVGTDAGIEIGLGAGEVAVTATEAVAATAVVEAVVGCVASVVCAAAVGTAGAVAAFAAYHRIKAGSNGDVAFDAGQDPSVQQVMQWTGKGAPGQVGYFGSAQAACESYGDPGSGRKIEAIVNSDGQSAKCELFSADGNNDLGQAAGTQLASTTQNSCPPINGVVPTMGFDGKCPTGTYADFPPADIPGKICNYGCPLSGTGGSADAGEEAIDKGDQQTPADVTVSGPSTWSGTPTTSTTVDTAPDGSQQTTTTTSTPTASLKYGGNQVTATTGTSTTTSKSDGSTSTTTTTTPPADPGSTSTANGSGSSSSPDSADLCALHPGALACDTLGSPTGDGPQWTSQTVTFAPEDLGLPSGCPAPRTLTRFNLVLNYQPACDVAPMVAPALIAFTALGCAVWIMTVIKA